jgi:hypothetical protein
MRKGELSNAVLDRGWPHHAVIPADRCTGAAYNPAHERAEVMGCALRVLHIHRGRHFLVFRFREPEQAVALAAEFGGETYHALERGRGSGWEKWRKKVKAG